MAQICETFGVHTFYTFQQFYKLTRNIWLGVIPFNISLLIMLDKTKQNLSLFYSRPHHPGSNARVYLVSVL